jgi:hypothetical protein
MSDELNTVRSAKDFFFPQTENLMEFKTEGKQIEVIDIREEYEDFVIFGVRACDVKSFEILDRVFLNDVTDTFYGNRREHGVIVSMACSRPVETCFCQTFDIDAANPAGDITCWKTDADVYFRANTEKGEALLAKLDSLTEESDDSAVKAQQEKTAEIMNIHTNTVQYRLKKINEILGAEITGNRVIPGLTIALALQRLEEAAKQ